MEVMFVDDTNFFFSDKNIDTLFAIVNVELENISTRFTSNNLSLNVDKNKWSLFHLLLKRQFLLQNLPNLVIEDIHIKREHVTRLGAFSDENLSWKKHIDIITSHKNTSKTNF